MKEGTIEKHLKRMTVLVVVISLAIMGAGGIVTLSLNRVQQEGIDSRIQGEVEVKYHLCSYCICKVFKYKACHFYRCNQCTTSRSNAVLNRSGNI